MSSSCFDCIHYESPIWVKFINKSAPYGLDVNYLKQIERPYCERFPQNGGMKRLLQFLQRLIGKAEKPLLHTPEELECFKRDALENRGKHY